MVCKTDTKTISENPVDELTSEDIKPPDQYQIYYMVTQAHAYKQLAQGCPRLKAERPGIKPVTFSPTP